MAKKKALTKAEMQTLICKNFNIESGDVRYFNRGCINLGDFRNKVLVTKTGVDIDRFLFINSEGDILEQGWDASIYNPGTININYKMNSEIDFIINKEEVIPIDDTHDPIEVAKKLRAIYETYMSAKTLMIVWIEIRDTQLIKHLLIFSPEITDRAYKWYMNNDGENYG